MKTMTCNQLGGACDEAFHANTFEEMSQLSRNHGMEMYQKKDTTHTKAMADMVSLMQSPEKMNAWFLDKKKQFEALPED